MLLHNAAKETAARLFSLLDGRDHSAGQRTACVFIIVKASCKGENTCSPLQLQCITTAVNVPLRCRRARKKAAKPK